MGKDEYWLQDWIAEDPARLGLGPLNLVHKELRQYGSRGGRLYILAYRTDLNTYYEIEVMLGECDSDHGFRILEYWAQERARNPNSRHVAVLVAEDLSLSFPSTSFWAVNAVIACGYLIILWAIPMKNEQRQPSVLSNRDFVLCA